MLKEKLRDIELKAWRFRPITKTRPGLKRIVLGTKIFKKILNSNYTSHLINFIFQKLLFFFLLEKWITDKPNLALRVYSRWWVLYRSQKSEHRPFRSQSPYRVGSGPFGPPISPVCSLTWTPPPPSSSSSTSSPFSPSGLCLFPEKEETSSSSSCFSRCCGCWAEEQKSRLDVLEWVSDSDPHLDLAHANPSLGAERSINDENTRLRLLDIFSWSPVHPTASVIKEGEGS